MSPQPRIPGFEFEQLLGGGLTTSVWSARELATDERVAVKLLRMIGDDTKTGLELLRCEAEAGLAIRHPHLVRIRSASLEQPPFFVVMDLLRGDSVRRRLTREFRLDMSLTLWVARQTAQALAALHRAGFVHGDVKPDNIFLTESGPAVLIDMGFAHRTEVTAKNLNSNLLLGTANYLAPERCVLDPNSDGRADVFSLGVTLFEMLTGELPFPIGSAAETLRSHSQAKPISLQRHVGNLPASLIRLLHRMMARRPSERLSAAMCVPELIRLEIAVLRRKSA